MRSFAERDNTSASTVKDYVKWKDGKWELQPAINGTVNRNRKHYENLFEP
jgi:hypothetical protein